MSLASRFWQLFGTWSFRNLLHAGIAFVPIPQMAVPLDHLVGDEERGRDDNTERLGGFDADD
jgi:hypothetical protein